MEKKTPQWKEDPTRTKKTRGAVLLQNRRRRVSPRTVKKEFGSTSEKETARGAVDVNRARNICPGAVLKIRSAAHSKAAEATGASH